MPAVSDVINQNGTDAQKAMLGTSNTNWQGLIYQKAFGTQNISLSGGGIKAMPYRISRIIQTRTVF